MIAPDFTPAELHFLLGACGVLADDESTTRPGGTDLTAQGVLALRSKLEGMAAPVAPAPPELCRCGNPACPGARG